MPAKQGPSRQHRLFAAALETRSVEKLSEAIAGGLDLKTIAPKQGNAAVALAAYSTGDSALRALLQAGFDPNGPSKRGKTPLFTASRWRQPQIVKTLLEFGANPNGGAPGSEPLWQAVTASAEIVAMLIEAGASTDIKDKRGFSPLHAAAEYGHQGTVQALLHAGVPVDQTDDAGNTVLHKASSYSNPPLYALLLAHGADVDLRSRDGLTPALCASRHGQINVFEALVQSGADPLARTNSELDALDLAVVNGKDDMAAHLLRHYPALSPSGEALDKLFVFAVRYNCPKTVIKLAEMGADLGQKPDGRSLMQCAPRDADELKRVLRSIKTESAIQSAMSDSDEPAPVRTSLTL